MSNYISIKQPYLHVVRCTQCGWYNRHISPMKAEMLDCFALLEHGLFPGHELHFRISNRDNPDDLTEWYFKL